MKIPPSLLKLCYNKNMSTHINAPEGAIAEGVLLPGDPLRAKYIAENFLENPVCYNEVRGMYGFTGTYKGKKVSVQGSGMGMPSLSIYVNELYQFYNVKKIIRVGTIGAIQDDIKVRDTIIANAAFSDSSLINQRFGNFHYAPVPDFGMLYTAFNKSKELGIDAKVGPVVSSDLFYDKNETWRMWKEWGAIGIEMESAELFTLASQYKRKALSIFTASNHIVTGEESTAEERQLTFNNMIKLALETIIED